MVNYACAFSQSESGKYFDCGDWQQMSCINSPALLFIIISNKNQQYVGDT